MSESLLRTLMQLFAIVANVNKESISLDSRNIVVSYLKSFLPQSFVDQYLAVFDEYLTLYHSSITNYSSRHSLHGIKLLKICQEINEQLIQSQKYVVLIQLLEFIRNGEYLTEKELDFSETIATVFNISDDEYNHCKSFVLDPDITLHDCILIVDKNESHPNTNVKHINRANLSGQIIILFIKSTNMYFIRYNGSDDISLNNQSTVIDRSYTLDAGASIRSSKIKTIYYNEITEKFSGEFSSLNFTFIAENVNYKFNNSENGIKNFNLSEKSGSIIGILGISGVGKSTLINLLNGKLQPQKGKVLINNEELYSGRASLKQIIGYVPQDDLLIDELSVYHNLHFNARLCFGNLTEIEIENKVIQTIKDFDLYDIKDLKVGDPLHKFISGGERKRLNLALELIREPYILFVDEPTSGLSSMDSVHVMDLLKEQALNGKLVIISIHQPSSEIYTMFDKTIVLDKGGHTIYQGNPVEAITYFKTTSQQANFSSIQCETCGNLKPESILQIVDARVVDEYGRLTSHRKISAEEWADLFKEHVIPHKVEREFDDIETNNTKVSGKLKQFGIFFKRDLFSKLSNRQYLFINLLEAPLLAIIISYFCKYYSQSAEGVFSYIFSFNENLPIYLFLSVIVSMFMGLTDSVEEIIHDKKLLEREKYLRLSKSSYYLGKTALLFLISAIQTFVFTLLANYVLEINGLFFSYWLILFSASCFSNILGLNISRVIKSDITAYILIPIILIPQIMFCGIVVDFDKMHKSIASNRFVPIIGDLMVSRWAYEALAVNQFKNNSFEKPFFEIEKQMSRYAYQFNYLIPELLDNITECDSNIQYKKNVNETVQTLQLIENEMDRLQGKYLDEKKLVSADNTKFLQYREYLYTLKNYCVSQYSKLRKEKDRIIKEQGKIRSLEKSKLDNYNGKLADLVLNNYQPNKIVRENNFYIQKANIIFKEPESNFGRAHFYSSEKKMLGYSFDTYWFNLIVIWMGILLLFCFLYINILDFLRKIIQRFLKNE